MSTWYVVQGVHARFKVEISTRGGVERAHLREMWDDTRLLGDEREFGWVFLLPAEQQQVDVDVVRRSGTPLPSLA